MKKSTILFLSCFLLVLVTTSFAMELKGKFSLSGNFGLGFPMGDFADKGYFSDSLFAGHLKERGGSAKSGFGFGGNFEYFVTNNISIGGNFTHQTFGMKTKHMEKELESLPDEDLEGITITANADGNHKVTSFGVFGKYLFTTSSQIVPYLKFGLGIAKLKPSLDISGSVLYSDPYYGDVEMDYDISAEREVDSKMYVDIGGGILYELSPNIALTGEVLYTHLMTDGAGGHVDMRYTVSYMGENEREKEKFKDKLNYNVDYISVLVGLTFFFGGTK